MPMETVAGKWQVATVVRVWDETPTVKSVAFTVPDWRDFRPGQHLDVRLTAPDGYQAQRSYSIASAPEDDGPPVITIELIADGEVSPYFHFATAEGGQFEIRGPVGGPFTWTTATGGPLLLVGGGSGVVPLMSMLRHRQNHGAAVRALLLQSARSFDELIYRHELEDMATAGSGLSLVRTLTRQRPAGWTGYARRVDTAMLADVLSALGMPASSYLCGPAGFVDLAARELVGHGAPPEQVRMEMFGPTGQ